MTQTIRRFCLAAFVLGLLTFAQTRTQDRGAITATINDCELQTNSFVGSLRQDFSQADVRYEREDDLLRSARNLENAMDKVGDARNRDNNPERVAIGAAREINQIMVRRELNLLSRAFNTQGLGR